MQTISTNRISQTQHGPYKAVDISPRPDPDYYAPEDGEITALGMSGTCGLRLELTGATGRHGFCHNASAYVKVGDSVKRGQKLARMGFTGYTVPAGAGGTHVHWVISKNGVYVYPPSLVDETFIKLEGSKMTPTDVLRMIASEIEGFDSAKTHAGEYDVQLKGAWGNKPPEEYIRHAWSVQKTKRGDLTNQIADLKKQLADSGTLPPGNYVRVDAEDLKVIKE